MKENLDLLIPKAVALGTGAAAIVQALFTPGANLPFFEVTMTTLGMATAGSMLGFAYGTPVKSRKKLFGYAVGGIFVGVWSVKVMPLWFGWEWYVHADMAGPVAGAVALVSRWLIPLILESLPALVRRILNTGGHSGGTRNEE